MKVLIVVDERKHAAFFVQLMREEGYASDVCASGTEAIKKGQSNRYSLILLDWILRDIDGCSVCRELRRNGVSTPILMLAVRQALPDQVLALEGRTETESQSLNGKRFVSEDSKQRPRCIVSLACAAA